jgi:hypothetical protein
MAGTIICDRIESDASFPSSINIASPIIVSNTFAIPAGSVGAPALSPVGDTNTGIYFPAADAIGISTNGVDRIRVTSAGDVGIGTNTPGSKLDVLGSVGDVAIFRQPNVVLKVGTTNSENGEVYYDSYPTSNPSLRSAQIWRQAGAESMRLDTGRTLVLRNATTGGAYIRGQEVSYAPSASTNVADARAGALIICVYDTGSGRGGVFFATYTGSVIKLAGDGAVSDSGTDQITVYKSVNNHLVTYKNRSSITINVAIGVYSASAIL